MSPAKHIVALGAAGGVGGLFARLLGSQGYQVFGVDAAAPRAVAPHHQADVLAPPRDGALEQAFARADAVIVALPDAVARAALPWMIRHARADAVIVPTCSVQQPFFQDLAAIAPEQPCLGLNPMFSPSLQPEGRVIASCLTDTGSAGHWLERSVQEAGMRVKRLSPERHDQLMSLCQTLPHAAIISFGLALSDSGGLTHLDTIVEMAPPPMRTMLALLSRILTNPAEVYWDIQSENPHGERQRAALSDSIRQLSSMVGAKDSEAFALRLRQVAARLGTHLESGAEDCQAMFSSLA